MSKKANIICMVICIVVTLAIVGGAVVGVVNNSTNNEGKNPNTDETSNDDSKQNTDETEGNKESESTSSDLTDIPSIREDPTLPDAQGQASIDVGEMTKNPEAEVVDSRVEYETKEGNTDAE